METKFQTSFIPKTNLEPVANSSKRPMAFFTFVSTIIFFLSVLVAGGAFGWHKYLESSKAKMKESLERNIKSFEPQTIDEYYRLNNRIDAAKTLLANHVAVSYIFDFLSEETLQSVKFNDFKYDIKYDANSKPSAMLTMNGEAKSYNAVAYQSEVFGREDALNNPIFSNLDLDTVGNVIFNFTTGIDSGFITYTRKANTVNSNEINEDIESIPDTTPLLVNPQGASTNTR